MSWHYGAIKNQGTWQVHEIIEDGKSKRSWTVDPITITGETALELLSTLSMIEKDLLQNRFYYIRKGKLVRISKNARR